MTCEEAREFLKELLPINPALNRALLFVQEHGSHEEFERLRKVVAHLIARKYNELERPIHEQFPELEPEATRSPGT